MPPFVVNEPNGPCQGDGKPHRCGRADGVDHAQTTYGQEGNNKNAAYAKKSSQQAYEFSNYKVNKDECMMRPKN